MSRDLHWKPRCQYDGSSPQGRGKSGHPRIEEAYATHFVKRQQSVKDKPSGPESDRALPQSTKIPQDISTTRQDLRTPHATAPRSPRGFTRAVTLEGGVLPRASLLCRVPRGVVDANGWGPEDKEAKIPKITSVTFPFPRTSFSRIPRGDSDRS